MRLAIVLPHGRSSALDTAEELALQLVTTLFSDEQLGDVLEACFSRDIGSIYMAVGSLSQKRAVSDSGFGVVVTIIAIPAAIVWSRAAPAGFSIIG